MLSRCTVVLVSRCMAQSIGLLSSLALIAASGCNWISDLTVDGEIREKGMLQALRRPIPLDEKMPPEAFLHCIEHPAEMDAALDRLEDLADDLSDPTQRSAYAELRASGNPARTANFLTMFSLRDAGVGGDDRILELWERVDDALAAGDDPILVDDRVAVLAALVREGAPDAGSRLAEAIRDDWNPDAAPWISVMFFLGDPSDAKWSDAWAAASEKNLDNALGWALLRKLSEAENPPSVHPFATPQGMEMLTRNLRTTKNGDQAQLLLGQFGVLDEASAEILWQAAKERPQGLVRLQAAFEMFRRTKSAEALAEMKSAVKDERLALAALNYLSRCGQIEGIELPSGEALARAKAYHVVGIDNGFVDDEIAQATLEPLLSGPVRHDDEEFQLSLFRYSIPTEIVESLRVTEFNDGLAFVDDGLMLAPAETGPVVDETGVECEDLSTGSSLMVTHAAGPLGHLRDAGCRTFLDLIAATDVPGNRYGSSYAWGRNDEFKAELLAEDERWKAFDVTFESLDFAFPVEGDAAGTEGMAP